MVQINPNACSSSQAPSKITTCVNSLPVQHVANINQNYTSLLVKNYLQKSKVIIIEWPAKNPALNPIIPLSPRMISSENNA